MDLGFPALWLRDNCPCPACRDAVSGQKLHTVGELAGDVAVTAVGDGGDGSVAVAFSDGHRSVFARAWLDAHREPDLAGDGRTAAGKALWDTVEPPVGEWAEFAQAPGPLLRRLWETGFVLLRGTPVEPGAVLRVARAFGHVRTTNYGELFDVRVEERAVNLAFTGRAIAPHSSTTPGCCTPGPVSAFCRAVTPIWTRCSG